MTINMIKFSAIKYVLLSSVAMGGLSLAPAMAQDGDKITLEEIIVTARRRDESLQDVPIAVTAFSASDMEMQGISDITELAQSTPSLTLEPSRATNNTLSAFLRGVGQQDPLAGFEPGVALYMDDVYLARPHGALLEVLDVERIEILRGPQGTLYGRNAMGGAIKYVTKRLSDETEAKINGNLGNYGQADIAAAASTAIGDNAKIGFAATKLSRGGYGRNTNLNKDNYNKDLFAARGTVELTPSTDLFIRIMADYTKDNSNPKHGHRLFESLVTGSPVLDNVYDTLAGADDTALAAGIGNKNQVTNKGISGLIEYTMSDTVTLKSITAYRKDHTGGIIDFDSLPGNTMDAVAIYDNDQFTQELQLLYNSGKVSAVTGLFYIDANAANDFDIALGALGPIGTYTGGDFNTKSWSAFADVTYDMNEEWSVTLGGRYTHDKRSAIIDAQLILGPPSVQLGGSGVNIRTDSAIDNSRTDTKFTPRVLVNYTPNEDMNFYATYSQGFKAGGFDPRAKNIATGVEAVADGYKPEVLNNFELGMKSTLAEGRAQLNVALFHSKLTDMQIPGSIPIPGVTGGWAGRVENAGRATFKGIEIESRIAVTENFRLSTSLSYIDAEINEWIFNGVDISSTKVIQNTPEYQANVTANYTHEMDNGVANLSVSWNRTGDSHQFETPQPAFDQKAYSLWNASMVWTPDNGALTLGIHVKNIGNKRYITSGYDFMSLVSLVPEGVLTAFYGAPRTVTVSAGISF